MPISFTGRRQDRPYQVEGVDMRASAQGDWVEKFFLWFFGFGFVVILLVFAADRAQAIFTPKQYAAAQAAQKAEKAAEDAREAEAQRQADAEQAEHDAAEHQQALAYELASSAFSNFKRSLRDPEGARFRDVWAVRSHLNGVEIVAACGVVNAPNGFGAYTGEMPFMAAASRIYTPEYPSFAGLFQDVCLNGEKVVKLAG